MSASSRFKTLLPILILLTLIALFFALGGHNFLTLEKLNEHRGFLQGGVQDYPILSVAVFIIIYIVVVAASLPGASIFSLSAGFLFGQWIGTGVVVVGATLGAVILFILVQTTFGTILKAKAGPWFTKISDGFKDNAISYMLFLRLVPLFPFFAVNIAGAMMGVRLSTFTLTTALGIIPGSFVFVSAGVGLDAVIETGQIINQQTQFAFIGLGIVSLIPIIYKVITSKRSK